MLFSLQLQPKKQTIYVNPYMWRQRDNVLCDDVLCNFNPIYWWMDYWILYPQTPIIETETHTFCWYKLPLICSQMEKKTISKWQICFSFFIKSLFYTTKRKGGRDDFLKFKSLYVNPYQWRQCDNIVMTSNLLCNLNLIYW